MEAKREWESYFWLYDLVFAVLDAGRFAQSCWALAVSETQSFWWILWEFARTPRSKDNDQLVLYIVKDVVPEIQYSPRQRQACGECFQV